MIEPTVAGFEQSRFYQDILEKGIERGIEQGSYREKEQTTVGLARAGMTKEFIANITKLSLEEIEQILRKHLS
ncbi:MAG: hypothetical protein EAZ92_15830 [Candidatus Kapaibacterium sp.]|nr:MAG: hypothetical protein EAZ92_15830 [Candidatus Kapabacteria bacterium]